MAENRFRSTGYYLLEYEIFSGMLRIKQMIIINKQKYKFFKISTLDDFEKRLILSLDFKSSYIIFLDHMKRFLVI